jgi:hypothetical protein
MLSRSESTISRWSPFAFLFAEVGRQARSIVADISVFERFPDDDGAGVFWSIVHGLEALPGYEHQLLTSISRVPSDMGVTMLGRLLNAGCDDIDGVPTVASCKRSSRVSTRGRMPRKQPGSFSSSEGPPRVVRAALFQCHYALGVLRPLFRPGPRRPKDARRDLSHRDQRFGC